MKLVLVSMQSINTEVPVPESRASIILQNYRLAGSAYYLASVVKKHLHSHRDAVLLVLVDYLNTKSTACGKQLML